MNRRKFLSQSALASAGLLAAPSLFANSMEAKIKSFGFQVYTLRDVIYKDMEGTLSTMKKAGYDYAEFFDFAEGKLLQKPVKEAKAIIDKTKIKPRSIHVMTGAMAPEQKGTILNDWQMSVDAAAELGAEYLICAYLMDFERETIDQYKALAEKFNEAGEACKKAGIQFCYHNHDFEFQKIDGQLPYDILLKETDPGLMKMELDIYWAKYINVDPVKLFQADKGRYPLWHVKDLSAKQDRLMTEVGNGTIDWAEIFSHANDAGMKGFFVEQDRNFASDSVSSLQTSINYLKKLKY
ncbi:sugar phosphate isomerase/epimerase family protein [Roseivirga pacifica]